MRRGMHSLALQVQQSFGRDPFVGDLYIFRGRRGDCQRHCKNPRKWQSKIPHFAVRAFRWFVRRLHFLEGVRGVGARRAQAE